MYTECVLRIASGRGLTSIKDSVVILKPPLEDYTHKRRGNIDYTYRKQYRKHNHEQNRNKQKRKWEGKQLYGHFKQQTNKISHGKTLSFLKKETFREKHNLFW